MAGTPRAQGAPVMPVALARAMPLPPGLAALRRHPLAGAVAASLLLHAAFLAVHFGGLEGRRPLAGTTMLYASLAPAVTRNDAPAAPAVLDAPSAVVLPDVAPVPAVASEGSPSVAQKAAKGGGDAARTADGLAFVRVAAQPLADRNRLGDLYARQLTEFPIEVDRPVRMVEPVVARFPRSALAQGRDENVGVWIVVNAQGSAEEVQVLDGAPEFAEEVVAAVNAARFEPAENRLRKIRFPLSLEFRFDARADAAAAARTAVR